MRWLVVLGLLVVPARCQLLAFSSDMSGHYVPSEGGHDCPLFPPSVSLVPEKLELEVTHELLELEASHELLELEVEEPEAADAPSYWGNCGIGGIPRLAGQLKTLQATTEPPVTVTAGNIIGTGNWELPVNFSAAVEAASLFDVMGLGPGEFSKGGRFLTEFLKAVSNTTGGKTSFVACNVKSGPLADLVVPAVNKSGVHFIGFVDPDVVEDYVAFDPDMQLSNLTCIQQEVDKLKGKMPIVVVGSASSINASYIQSTTGVDAFILSGLPDADKIEKAQEPMLTTDQEAAVLFTQGNGDTVTTFNISNGGSNSVQLDSNVADDNITASSVAALQETVSNFYDTSVTSYYLLTAGNCTGQECSIGDVICDAMLIGSLLDGRLTQRPLAIWPGKNLNGTIPKGDLTVSDLYSVLPAGQVAVARASGDTVTQLFARAVRHMTVDASSSDTFLQVSGVRVTYDLDLPEQYRPKYLMNLCLTCSPQQYLPVSPGWNYTVVLAASMLGDPDWSDITSQFTSIYITGFSAREAVSAKAQAMGRLLAPVGSRLGFTHIPPDMDPAPDTFVAVLSTVVVCMAVFGFALIGFRVWSRRQSQFGSSTALIR